MGMKQGWLYEKKDRKECAGNEQGYSEQGKKRKRWREDGDELKQYRKTQDCEGWTEEKVALHRPLRNTHPPHPRQKKFWEWNLQNYLLDFGLGLIRVVDFWDLLE